MTQQLNYIIRSITPADEQYLRKMLYYAIYVPKGSSLPAKNIINRPELARYVKGWSKTNNDIGLIAINELNQQPIGAAWIRLMTHDGPGYGYVEDKIPELSMAVLPEFRNRGIGTLLLSYLLEEADKKYGKISLSVTAGNPAVKLYERNGFKIMNCPGTSLIMIRNRKK